ncbi:MAG TPA: peptidoglycan editing factor PgeF [Acidisphaera sp.]|nr:peptidoglycan editing factor PgeF [Acidisphaera sp.]
MTDAITTDLLLPHGFFTRRGGVSSGPYASLNCSLSGGDDRAAVLQNRARAAAALGASPQRLLGLMQVHGARVVRVREAWEPGQGPQADAAVSDRPGDALAIVTADCAPVLFADAEAGVIGAAHAGWRGAVAGVLDAAVAAMTALGARPERITAAIGPCIAQDSYEVGPDLRDSLLGHDPRDAGFFTPGHRADRWQFDLPGYCAARLAQTGVGRVVATGIDTMVDETRFFSHRRRTLAGGGPIGHQISIVALPG